MNGDDIVFGEMKVREPQRLTRPDRDRKYACLAYEVPSVIDLPIFLDRRTADAIERHALSDTSVELGGILLGKECIDPATGQPFVLVTKSLEARHYANTQASFTYTHDSWEEITRERDRLHPEDDIVGWYHTHPSFGIFLSHHDLFIHQHFFAQPLQVAYVVDPINQTRGFFQWRDGGLAQVDGYYLVTERTDRLALARLVNDLEKLPNPEGGGNGSLSPRLEAELIKMLTRPASSPTISHVERLQVASVSGILGTFVGVLLVAMGLWLYQIQNRMQTQGEAMAEMARAVDELNESQRLATDTLLSKISADKPEQFLAQYNKATKERDDLKRALAVQRSMSEELGASAKAFAEKLETTEKELAKARADAREMPDLRKMLTRLEESNDKKQRELDDAAPILSYKDGKAAVADLLRELDRARLVGYAGWATSALLLIGLVAAFFFYKPALTDEPAPEPPDGDRPTHRIV